MQLETQLQEMSHEYNINGNAEIQNKGCSLKEETRDIMCCEN